MKLTVIIPCYNMGKYLNTCLQSIVSDNLRDYEIICVNDGSTDDTEKIFHNFKYDDKGNDRYPWLRMIHQENQGLSGARNTGLMHAEGEYLAFVDPDDTVLPNGINSLLKCAEETGWPDVVVGAMRVVRENGEERLNDPGNGYVDGEKTGALAYERLSGCYLHCTMSSKLYKAATIRESGLKFSKEIAFAEDACFNAMFMPYIKSIAFCSAPMYCYKFNDISLSARFKGQRYIDSRIQMHKLWHTFFLSFPQELSEIAIEREKQDNAYGWLKMIFMVYQDKSVSKKWGWLKKINDIAYAENAEWKNQFKYGLPKYFRLSSKFGLLPTHLFLSICAHIPAIRKRFR